MTLVGLDLDATRLRAVSGPAGPPPAPLRLAPPRAELPLAVCLESRQPQVGAAAVGLCRRLPDFACLDFLPHLGTERIWSAPRHRMDAERAMSLSLEHLSRLLGRTARIAAAVPPYLSEPQRELLAHLAEKARCRLQGWLPRPLAAVWAAHDRLPWSGRVLVLEMDGHALSCSAVAIEGDRAWLVSSQSLPALGRNAWLSRLLDGVARRCVRQSRRDPRESAEAEQYLYDQLVSLLASAPPGEQPVEFVLQTTRWYQRVSLPPQDLVTFCAPLAARTVDLMKTVTTATMPQGPVGAVLLTSGAGRLPGLVEALNASLEKTETAPPADEEDFGEGLLQEDDMTAGSVHLLDVDAVARAAHQLAVRQGRGEVQPGPATTLRLPPRSSTPRLHAGEADPAPGGYRIPFPSPDANDANPAPPPTRRRSPKDSD